MVLLQALVYSLSRTRPRGVLDMVSPCFPRQNKYICDFHTYNKQGIIIQGQIGYIYSSDAGEFFIPRIRLVVVAYKVQVGFYRQFPGEFQYKDKQICDFLATSGRTSLLGVRIRRQGY